MCHLVCGHVCQVLDGCLLALQFAYDMFREVQCVADLSEWRLPPPHPAVDAPRQSQEDGRQLTQTFAQRDLFKYTHGRSDRRVQR